MVALGTVQKEALGKFQKRRHLSLKEIAERTGWSRPYVSQVFSGERKVPENFIEDLNKQFGLQPDEREELRLAIRSSERRVDLSDYSPSQRVIISTLVREIGCLDMKRQEELLTLVKAYVKLEGDDLETLMQAIPLDKLTNAQWKYFDSGTGHDPRFGLGVKPRSFKNLVEEANNLRSKLGFNSEEPLNLRSLIEDRLDDLVPGSSFQTVNRMYCDKTKGFTDIKNKRIIVTDQVWRDWCSGDVNSEWVVAHELGHLWLHSRHDVFDIDGVGFNDAERQANNFAGVVKAPVGMFRQGHTEFDLAACGRVPMQWAKEIHSRYRRQYSQRSTKH